MERRYGVIVIGDEILSGRRQDKHMAKAIELLAVRGEQLSWARYIADQEADIVAALQLSMQTPDTVFCFGGIGATPDDLTRQCAATAAGVELVREPEARALIETKFGAEAYPMRILMADLPSGCTLIPNPYNQIPGFSLGDHHFLPGFPVMAHPMMQWVLETHYPCTSPADYLEVVRYIHDTPESSLIMLMRQLADDFPALRFFSLPIHSDTGIRVIEFGAKGPSALVGMAMLALETRLSASDMRWTLTRE
jgi:molybdopterin-biosynthesis enzyme MoeA-like protein